MVELAIENENRIEVSHVDVVRDKTTYSIDTINDLRPQYGVDHEFILAIGTDAVPDLHRWHRYDELIDECTLAVVERPGSPLDGTVSLPKNTLVIRGPMVQRQRFSDPIHDRARRSRRRRECFTRISYADLSSKKVFTDELRRCHSTCRTPLGACFGPQGPALRRVHPRIRRQVFLLLRRSGCWTTDGERRRNPLVDLP